MSDVTIVAGSPRWPAHVRGTSECAPRVHGWLLLSGEKCRQSMTQALRPSPTAAGQMMHVDMDVGAMSAPHAAAQSNSIKRWVMR